MKKPRYQDFLDELASGSKYGVFIDDTGSPGLKSTPPNLHPKRKSWVGVVVPPSQMLDVIEQLPEAAKELHSITGADEFHFADIYSGTRKFKGINLQMRLAIFEFMAEIFRVYRFPIFIQTLDPNSLKDIRNRGPFPDTVGLFNLKKPEDTALFFLLLRIKWHIEKHRACRSETARVFIDEGYMQKGTAIHVPAWKTVFADGLLCFARSSLIYPIQLADFAAFVLNRTQLLIGKEKLNSLDKRLLQISSPIAWNYQNIEKRAIQLKN